MVSTNNQKSAMPSKSVLSRVSLVLATFVGACAVATAQNAMPTMTDTSATQRAAVEAAFTRADTNGDGKLTRQESERLPAIAIRFDELDKDKDGFLSLEEFAAGALAK
jgi:Ca2+-binding EF-hand superfamily protein